MDRTWGIWGSYYNIPKAIFYLLKEGIACSEASSPALYAQRSTSGLEHSGALFKGRYEKLNETMEKKRETCVLGIVHGLHLLFRTFQPPLHVWQFLITVLTRSSKQVPTMLLQSAVILAVSVLKGPDPWSGWSPPCAAFAYSQEPPWTALAASQGLGLRGLGRGN